MIPWESYNCSLSLARSLSEISVVLFCCMVILGEQKQWKEKAKWRNAFTHTHSKVQSYKKKCCIHRVDWVSDAENKIKQRPFDWNKTNLKTALAIILRTDELSKAFNFLYYIFLSNWLQIEFTFHFRLISFHLCVGFFLSFPIRRKVFQTSVCVCHTYRVL